MRTISVHVHRAVELAAHENIPAADATVNPLLAHVLEDILCDLVAVCDIVADKLRRGETVPPVRDIEERLTVVSQSLSCLCACSCGEPESAGIHECVKMDTAAVWWL